MTSALLRREVLESFIKKYTKLPRPLLVTEALPPSSAPRPGLAVGRTRTRGGDPSSPEVAAGAPASPARAAAAAAAFEGEHVRAHPRAGRKLLEVASLQTGSRARGARVRSSTRRRTTAAGAGACRAVGEGRR